MLGSRDIYKIKLFLNILIIHHLFFSFCLFFNTYAGILNNTELRMIVFQEAEAGMCVCVCVQLRVRLILEDAKFAINVLYELCRGGCERSLQLVAKMRGGVERRGQKYTAPSLTLHHHNQLTCSCQILMSSPSAGNYI